MKNIPVFTTNAGIATLILREIPHFGRAYILPQSIFSNEEALVRECADFCRMAGAERVDVKLQSAVPGTAFSCEIWELVRHELPIPESNLQLERVRPDTAEAYRSFYNRRFRTVDNAAWCSAADAAEVAEQGGYILLERDEVIGAGQIWEGELRAIAAGKKGLGYALACALLRQGGPGPVRLQVASSNAPALQLYERLNFEKSAVRSRWYRALP